MQFRCDCAGWLGGEERAGRCMSRGGGRERGEGEKEREEEERRGEGKGRWEEGREKRSCTLLLKACSYVFLTKPIQSPTDFACLMQWSIHG